MCYCFIIALNLKRLNNRRVTALQHGANYTYGLWHASGESSPRARARDANRATRVNIGADHQSSCTYYIPVYYYYNMYAIDYSRTGPHTFLEYARAVKRQLALYIYTYYVYTYLTAITYSFAYAFDIYIYILYYVHV